MSSSNDACQYLFGVNGGAGNGGICQPQATFSAKKTATGGQEYIYGNQGVYRGLIRDGAPFHRKPEFSVWRWGTAQKGGDWAWKDNAMHALPNTHIYGAAYVKGGVDVGTWAKANGPGGGKTLLNDPGSYIQANSDAWRDRSSSNLTAAAPIGIGSWGVPCGNDRLIKGCGFPSSQPKTGDSGVAAGHMV